MTISDFDGAQFWPAVKAFVIASGVEPISLGEPEDEIWRKIFAAMQLSGTPLSLGMTPGELMRQTYAIVTGGGDQSWRNGHLLAVRTDVLADFNTWLGTSADIITEFVESNNGASTWAENLVIAQGIQSAYAGTGKRLDLAFPLCSTTQGLDETIAGTHDTTIRAILTALAAATVGAPLTVIRPGWEPGFTTAYPWSASSGAGRPALYTAASIHIIALIREIMPRAKISYCSTMTTTDYLGAEFNPLSCYAGDQYYDAWGGDVYSITPGVPGAQDFRTKRTGTYGLDWQYAQATSRGMPYIIHELGVNTDIPDFLRGITAWASDKQVAYIGYWDKGTTGNFADKLSDESKPNSSIQFRRDFGGLSIVTLATFTTKAGQILDFSLEASRYCSWGIAGGADASLFSIVNGRLISISALSTRAYEVQVRAMDQRGIMALRTLTITAQASAYLPETQFAAARMPAPTATYLTAMDAFITALKAADVWRSADAIHLFRSEAEGNARINLKSSDYTLVPAGSPVFTASAGVKGDGGTARYAVKDFVPSLPGHAFGQDDGYLGIYFLTNLEGNEAGSHSQLSFGRNSTGQVVGRPSQSATTTIAPSGSMPGYVSFARRSSSDRKGYANGAQVTAETTASSHFMHKEFTYLGSDLGNGVNTLGVGIIGGSRIADQEAAVNAAVLAFVTATATNNGAIAALAL